MDDSERDDASDYSSSSYGPPDDEIKSIIQAADHLLFGTPDPALYIPSLHPEQVQIFGLWHIYLANVDPLLKVTHSATLQPRIIEAARDVCSVSESLQALMFSIYCLAVHSMTDDECIASCAVTREHALVRYQIACKQALLQCNPWRSDDLDSLLALYLYLVSA